MTYMDYIELNLSLNTPFLPGSADANRIDQDWPLRPSEVKGIWRWWARALVAGVLFDRGLLHGRAVKDLVKVTSREEASCISRITGLYLGLGYAGGKDSKASCFRIMINPSTQQYSPQSVNPNLANQLQRIKLLTLGKRSIEYIDRVFITLRISENIPCDLGKEAMEASLSALALAFRYSCFGKGGRRGLGCFSIKPYGQYSKFFLMNDQELLNTSVSNVSKVVDHVLKQGECRKLEERNIGNCELPPMPIISKNPNYINCVEQRETGDAVMPLKSLSPYNLFIVNGSNLLNMIHNFFLRPNRARVLLGNPRLSDRLRLTLNAWVLGLPREQRNTGYFITSNANRRASPILVAVHDNKAYISVFTSADWPKELKWRGADVKPIPIDEPRVINATFIALQELISYLKKNNLQVNQIWP